MPRYLLSVKSRHTENHIGILRILKDDTGFSQVDYFLGAKQGQMDFNESDIEFHVEFTRAESVIDITQSIMGNFPYLIFSHQVAE